MEQVIQEFSIPMDKEDILRKIGCSKGCAMYDEYSEEYDKIIQTALELIHPVAILKMYKEPEKVLLPDRVIQTEVLYEVLTVGESISEQSTESFLQQKYIAGMLYSSIADAYLFGMDKSVTKDIISWCKASRMGVERRLEAPTDLALSMQSIIIKKTNAHKIAKVHALSSGMLNPVKSMCTAYLLKEELQEYHVDHVCSLCKNRSCSYREL